MSSMMLSDQLKQSIQRAYDEKCDELGQQNVNFYVMLRYLDDLVSFEDLEEWWNQDTEEEDEEN